MNPWRPRLLVGIVLATSVGWGLLFAYAEPSVRGRLLLLSGVFAVGTAAVGWHYRARVTARLATAYLALGAIVHAGTAGLVVGADVLWREGIAPALAESWVSFALGALGIGASAFTWTRARGGGSPPARHVATDRPEPPPPPSPELEAEPDWPALTASLKDDPIRARMLAALQRVHQAIDAGPDGDPARRVVRQELLRLDAEARASARQADEDDVLTQAASLLEWGAQKLPELAELDVSDLLMAKAIADIRASASAVEHTFVPHRDLRAIHPIDRATADAKCEERAQAARDALPLLRANGMRLSEDLIAAEDALAAFRSVTGFQVIQTEDGGYVTFEGNGRREALQRAFGDEPVFVEVRNYTFDDPETARTMRRRVERVRRWKGVADGR